MSPEDRDPEAGITRRDGITESQPTIPSVPEDSLPEVAPVDQRKTPPEVLSWRMMGLCIGAVSAGSLEMILRLVFRVSGVASCVGCFVLLIFVPFLLEMVSGVEEGRGPVATLLLGILLGAFFVLVALEMLFFLAALTRM
jgi:hypothetical protein